MSKTELQLEIEDFITHMDLMGKSENTIKTYTYSFNYFVDFLKKSRKYSYIYKGGSLKDVKSQTLTDFIHYLKRKGMSNRSVARHIAAIKTLIKYKTGVDVYVERPKIEQRLPEYLTYDEVKTMVDKAKDDGNYTTALMIELGYFCALRVSELIKLRVSNIDLDNKQIRIIGKGNKERQIPFESEMLYNDIKEYIEMNELNESDYLFSGKSNGHISDRAVEYRIKRYLKIIGKEQYGYHIFRHTRATELLRKGVDIRYVQDFLGHSNIDTTAIYAGVVQEDLRRKIRDVDTS